MSAPGTKQARRRIVRRPRWPALLRAAATTLHSPTGVRVLMGASLPRLAWAGRRGRAPGGLARIARTLALDRIPPEEREWATRIEGRRRELFSRQERARPFEESLPYTVSQASICTPIPPVWGVFLMRLVRQLRPQSCLELGTGIGISAGYEAAAMELNGGGRLITLDGSAEWAAVAKEGLASLGLGRVEFGVGPIADTLPDALERSAPVDYAFVDAEHTEEATIGYFESIVPHMSQQGVMVLDDIPWSAELRRTWRRIARDERVCAAFALGRMGVAVISRGAT
jgi:predicted O-methyltransferase YrrM